MTTSNFLVELGTEELPPKQLQGLSTAFGDGITRGLADNNIAHGQVTYFATPRRLAVLISDVSQRQADQTIERLGPAAEQAFDADGKPKPAALGFARSCGVSMEQLEKKSTEKGLRLSYTILEKGSDTVAVLPRIIEQSLTQLPTRKRMRWASQKFEFVRPVHWLVMLFDADVIDCKILGLQADRYTYGHRIHHPEKIKLSNTDSYVEKLSKNGYVEANFVKRREDIQQQINQLAQSINAKIYLDEDLLNEVTAIVEWPKALLGQFEKQFLQIPKEALISVMQSHQKYFPLVNNEGELQPYFITVANLVSNDPAQIIAGNEKVIRPRLSDAEFFFNNDKKSTLEKKSAELKKVVYQKKLGTLADKSQRLTELAGFIAELIGADVVSAKRAASLAKADLLTEMVQEFPELQGTMGYYYALNDHESEAVAKALHEQYMPRYANDDLPATTIGCILAIADKLDLIVGVFLLKELPTGDKDPYGLRRAALGLLRIIIDKKIDIDLSDVLNKALSAYSDIKSEESTKGIILDFIYDRLRGWYQDNNISVDVYLAVRACFPTKPLDFDARVKAVNYFCELPEAESLAAANKRVANILAKQEKAYDGNVRVELITEKYEQALYDDINNKTKVINSLGENDYQQLLEALADLRIPIDDFFDNVMVMVEDEKIRNNRLVLLTALRNLFLQVADISLLKIH